MPIVADDQQGDSDPTALNALLSRMGYPLVGSGGATVTPPPAPVGQPPVAAAQPAPVRFAIPGRGGAVPNLVPPRQPSTFQTPQQATAALQDPGIFGKPYDQNTPTVTDTNPLLDPGIFGRPSPISGDVRANVRAVLGGAVGFSPAQEPAGTGTGYDDPGIFGTPNDPAQATGRQGLLAFLTLGGLGGLFKSGAAASESPAGAALARRASVDTAATAASDARPAFADAAQAGRDAGHPIAAPEPPLAAPAPPARTPLSQVISPNDVRAFPPAEGTPAAPFEVRLAAARDAERLGHDGSQAILAADQRWNDLKAAIATAARGSEAPRLADQPLGSRIVARSPEQVAAQAGPDAARAAQEAKAPGAAAAVTPSGRFVVQQRGPTTWQVVDSTTGEGRSIFSTANGFKGDPNAAAQITANKLNAAGSGADRAAAITNASELFNKAAGTTTAPAASKGFGAPGTTFGNVDISQLVKTIQQTTPYKGIRDFGAAVRSGEAAKNGAPQGLIDQFLRGEAEVGMRARGVSEEQIAQALAQHPAPPAAPPAPPAPRPTAPNGPGGLAPLTADELAAKAQLLRDHPEFAAADPAGARLDAARAAITEGSSPNLRAVATAPSLHQPVNVPSVTKRPFDAMRAVENVMAAPKTLLTVSPLHATLRQALPFVSHPLEFGKAFGRQVGAFKDALADPADAAKALAERTDALRSAVDANGGEQLFLAKPGHGVAGGEEQIASNLLDKVPVLNRLVGASKGAFVTMNNEVRAGVFNNAVESAAKMGAPLSRAQINDLANTLNHFSGRGFNVAEGSGTEAFARAANGVFFSPQLAVSRVRMVKDTLDGFASAGNDIAHGRPPDPIALEKIRLGAGYVGALGGFYGLAQAAGLHADLNPDSTNFLRIDLGAPDQAKGIIGAAGSGVGLSTVESNGHVWLDPSAGESTLLKTVAQLFTGQKVTASGKDVILNAPGRYPTTYADVLGNYFRGKLGPIPGKAVDLAFGKDMGGNPVTVKSLFSADPNGLAGLIVPIMVHDYFAAGGGQSTPPTPARTGTPVRFTIPTRVPVPTRAAGAPNNAVGPRPTVTPRPSPMIGALERRSQP